MKPWAPTTLGYALLGLIHVEPRSGYALRKMFETTPMAHFSSSPGSIYPALRRLEEEGLIVGRQDRSRSMRPKRVYRLSRLGTETLRSWASQSVRREDIIWRLDELMLRFGAMAGLVDEAVTVRFLDELVRETEAYVGELETHRAALPEEAPLHGRLALEAGIEGYRAQARWARSARRQFLSAKRQRRKP